MASAEFADLVGAVAEGMGQRPDSVRGTPEGLLLHTTDGFVFAFLEDPATVSLANIQRLLEEPSAKSGRLVILTPGRLPLALAAEAERGRAALLEHDRFRELLRGLDLEYRLGEEPRGPHDVPGNRLLPSARRLDAVVARARTWLEWGVPALALRFYRQALSQKPGFLPARAGVGRSLTALGLHDEALATFREILEQHPGDLEARLGVAQVHAARGQLSEEIRLFEEILADRPDRSDVRAQLIAAQIEADQWGPARKELESMLAETPEDPRLRYLHSVTLVRTGAAIEGRKEAHRARELGLSHEQETLLAAHLGLPAPAPWATPEPSPKPLAAPRPAAPRPRASPPARATRPKAKTKPKVHRAVRGRKRK